MELQVKPLAQALTKFGLTDYESNVYLALMKNGPCGIKDITACSGVPRTKVYPVLKNLEKRKLVSFYPDKPIKVRGLAPDSSLTNPIKNMEQDIKVMKRAIQELRKIHESSSANDPLEKKEYWITRNKEEALKRLNDIINNASEEILLFVNHEGLDIVSSSCYDQINQASKNDIQVKILLNATKRDTILLNRFLDLVTIKYVPFSPENNLMLVDGKELLIFKKLSLKDIKSVTIVAEYYTGADVCDFLQATMAGLDMNTGKDLSILMPVIENSWLPDSYLKDPKVNQIPPIFYYHLMDNLSTRLGSKLNLTLTDLGRKTLDSIKKTTVPFIPGTLQEALNLLSSLYLLNDGVECKFIYDEPLNLLTCELTGELTQYYKSASERGFLIPPSVWGFFLLGLLDIFGFDASPIENSFNTNENIWYLQYKLISRAPVKTEKLGADEKEVLPKIT
ncbi:MAG: helix-turn-helix domain-containing protein [Candidatus Methanomethylicaceae archaeon]